MRTPQINTYVFNGSEFKGFEISIKFIIDYHSLLYVISKMLEKNNMEGSDEIKKQLYIEINKKNILKELSWHLWRTGNDYYIDDDYTHKMYNIQADQIIKELWYTIWEDYNESL